MSIPQEPAAPPAAGLVKTVDRALAELEGPLVAFALGLVHDAAQAREVARDSFLHLCRQSPMVAEGELRGWLFAECRNRALALVRKRQSDLPLDDIRWEKVAGSDVPVKQAPAGSLPLDEALQQLSASQREVILLKFRHGLSYREIRAVTGLTAGNVGFLMHTGLKRLQDALAGTAN